MQTLFEICERLQVKSHLFCLYSQPRQTYNGVNIWIEKGDNYKGVNYISFLVSKMTTLTIKILDLPSTVCITASQYYQLYREKLRLSMGYNQVWMKRFLVPRTIIIFQINLKRDNVKPESACRYPPILAPNLQRHEMTTKKTWVITLIILFT